MENNQNFQIKKTIRFGLSLKELDEVSQATSSSFLSKRYYKNHEKKFKTHQDFIKEITNSKINIEEFLPKNENDFQNAENDFQSILKKIVCLIKNLNEFVDFWKETNSFFSSYKITKDYYKNLAKKACFDPFWEVESRGEFVIAPSSSEININDLKNNVGRIKPTKELFIDRKYLIKRYFNNTLNKLSNAEMIVTKIIPLFNKEENKPNLINFYKAVISYLNLVNEFISPIYKGSIIFKNNNFNEGKIINPFVTKKNELNTIIYEIEIIRKYLESNGKTTPLFKITLNPYTAQQKPHIYTDEITNILSKLKFKELIDKLEKITKEENEDLIENHFKFINNNQAEKDSDKCIDKLKGLDYPSLSCIEKAQLFKYKQIPVNVRFLIVNFLIKDLKDKEKFDRQDKLLHILNLIGQSRSLPYIYNDIEQHNKKEGVKKNFNFYEYPLKPAFDFAWDSVIKKINNIANDIEDNKNKILYEKSSEFLMKKFNIDGENIYLHLTAYLLNLKDNISKLKNKNYNDINKILDSIKNSINNVREKLNNLKAINPFLHKGIEENIEIFNYHFNFKNYQDYNKYKLDSPLQKLNKIRGTLKNNINEYKIITEKFKKIAVEFGKSFAELREKLREENEINKIKYFGLILSDLKQPNRSINDKYLCLIPKKDDLMVFDILQNLKENNNQQLNSDISFEFITSLTPKSLEKIIKNKDAYKEFHSSITKKVNFFQIKQNWKEYKDDNNFIDYLKDCLINSPMASQQEWNRKFNIKDKLDACTKYEEIEKVVEQNCYTIEKHFTNRDKLIQLINQNSAIILPIINQDITAENQELKNQFSKDWFTVLQNEKTERLHPEMNIFYRKVVSDYPEKKRYSRNQLIANMNYEYIPNTKDYNAYKEQIKNFNDPEKQQDNVTKFNKNVIQPEFIIGIDRGLKQFATLCVIDLKGKIQGDFEIYTRTFKNKNWDYEVLEKRNILDLSNLRVETAKFIDGKVVNKQVLVDLSKIEYRGEKNCSEENKQTIFLEENYYKRQLQYQMQLEYPNYKNFGTNKITEFYEKYINKNIEIDKNNIEELGIEKWKVGSKKNNEHYKYLPKEELADLIKQYYEVLKKENDDKFKENEIIRLIELEPAFEIKSGIVANMVGIIAFLIKKYDCKVRVVLEDLSNSFNKNVVNKLTGEYLESPDFKEKENLELAGSGFYHYFEMQLLKKLFKFNYNNNILHLVPAFRSEANYEKIVPSKDKYVNYPFGIVNFVNPRSTSKRCPNCGKTNKIYRSNEKNIIVCSNCNYNKPNIEFVKSEIYITSNLHFITNADENAAYQIALKCLKNLKNK